MMGVIGMTDILTIVAQYGLAGIVIYIMYELFKWHTKEIVQPVREDINRLTNAIDKLTDTINDLRSMITRMNSTMTDIKEEIRFERDRERG